MKFIILSLLFAEYSYAKPLLTIELPLLDVTLPDALIAGVEILLVLREIAVSLRNLGVAIRDFAGTLRPLKDIATNFSEFQDKLRYTKPGFASLTTAILESADGMRKTNNVLCGTNPLQLNVVTEPFKKVVTSADGTTAALRYIIDGIIPPGEPAPSLEDFAITLGELIGANSQLYEATNAIHGPIRLAIGVVGSSPQPTGLADAFDYLGEQYGVAGDVVENIEVKKQLTTLDPTEKKLAEAVRDYQNEIL